MLSSDRSSSRDGWGAFRKGNQATATMTTRPGLGGDGRTSATSWRRSGAGRLENNVGNKKSGGSDRGNFWLIKSET